MLRARIKVLPKTVDPQFVEHEVLYVSTKAHLIITLFKTSIYVIFLSA